MRPDYMRGCTTDCERVVYCDTCGMRKQPTGRSVPMVAANSYCSWDCSGYQQDPKPGHLWPGELAEMDAPEESEDE